jgi:hypothetical protein
MEKRTWITPDDCRGAVGIFRIRPRKIHERGEDLRLANFLLQRMTCACNAFSRSALRWRAGNITGRREKILYRLKRVENPVCRLTREPVKTLERC